MFLCSCSFLEKKNLSFKKTLKASEKKISPVLSKDQDKHFLKQAKALLDRQKYRKAQKLFEKEISLNTKTQWLAKMYLGETLYKLKKEKQALENLKASYEYISDEEKIKNLEIQWKIVKPSKDHFDKLFVLSQMINLFPSLKKKQQAREFALPLIEGLSSSDIQDLKKNDNFEPIQDLLIFKAAKNLVKEKKYKKALDQFKKLSFNTFYKVEMEESVRQYIQALSMRTKVKKNTVGAILPLTGRHKKIGVKCLNGLQMGLGLYDEKPSDFNLVVLDSQSGLVKESVKKMILKHQAIGLVGGVLSQVASLLAVSAQNFMIPAIVLSQKSHLTKDKPFIFQNAVSSKHIIKQLVTTLMDHQNHKNFAILYPNDPFGVEYANLFWDYVLSKGGKVTGVQTYKAGETDFNDPIKRLTGTYYFEDRDEEYRDRLKKWFSKTSPKRNSKQMARLLSPVVDFSVIFIPDSIKSLHHISPYLSFQNIKGVQFAGPSLWNSPRILKQKKELIEGVVFVDSLIVKNPKFQSSRFSKKFQSIFGYPAGLFEFLSYQSALALRQVIDEGKSSREGLKEGLFKLKKLNSPIGAVSLSKDREFIYPISSFMIKKGEITSINF